MSNNGYFKWGKCKIRYHIDEYKYWLKWEDIANALNLDIEFNWVGYEEVKSILHNKYDDKLFVDSFLIWLENEVEPIVMREVKRIKKEKDLREQKELSSIRKIDNELVPILKQAIGNEEVNAVNARDLHKTLESKQDFSTWIKARIEKLKLTQGRDFEVFHKIMENSNGGRPLVEYIVSIEIAKHLCMIEMTDKGHKVREYFIECEKQLNKSQHRIPQTFLEALELAVEKEKQVLALQAQIESDKPKVEFANNVSQAENEVSIGEFAKILNIKGLGEKNLFKWLRDEGYLRLNNMPYQKYINKGYFRVVEKTREDKNGRIYTYTQTLITGQGQIYLQGVKNGE